ncbi:MAG: PKD domain-containing protein [Thermoplasmata archaeon]
MKTNRLSAIFLAIAILVNSFALFIDGGNLQSNISSAHDMESGSSTSDTNTYSSGGKATATVKITSPSDGAMVKGSFYLTVVVTGKANWLTIYINYKYAGQIPITHSTFTIQYVVNSWSPGIYVIGVQADDSQKDTVSIIVNDNPPTANAGPDKTVFANADVSFTGTGIDNDGTIKKYEWDFNGDGIYDWSSTATGSTTYKYSAAGVYNAKLRVTDNYGATATDTATIRVIQAPPTAYITTPSEGQTFDGNASIDFMGYGIDAESVFLTNSSIAWFSNVSGNLGTGNITLRNLAAGTHSINLTVRDSRGYTGSTVVNITVLPRNPIIVNVTFSGAVDNISLIAEVHIPFNASVDAYSGSGIKFYEWDADGDGVYEHNSNITGNTSIEFTSPGNTTISVRVTDGNGTQAIWSFGFRVMPNFGPQLTAAFTDLYSLISITNEDNFIITERRNFTINISAIDKDGIGSISIDLYGDGSYILTETNKEYCIVNWQYASPDNYTIKVSATDKIGAESNKTYVIHVIPNILPNADFVVSSDWSAFSPLQLFANASDEDGSITNYIWTFGDGSYSYEQNPTHTWTSKGTFIINLTVTDDLGGVNSKVRTISITNAAPIATLSANTTHAQTYTPIMFYEPDDPVDADGLVTLHSYDFGDGNITNIAGSNKTSTNHTYTSKGTYNVTLRVYDNDYGFGVSILSVDVVNTPPVFSLPDNITSQTLIPVKFIAGASDIDGTIVNYTWNFGDTLSINNTAYDATAFYTYATPGNYTVTLAVEDNDGGTTIRTMYAIIINRLPTCSFTASLDKKPAEELTFTVNATDSDGTVIKYKWDFGDKNSTDWVDNSVIKHTYMHAGKYDATLTVVDNNGGESAVAFITVTVVNILPVADIVRPKYVYVDEETQFFGNGSYDTHGAIVSYRWDFDDGTTSVEINPKHTYKRIGSYNVSLTVTDDGGDTDTDNEAIEIIGQAKPPPGSGEMDITNYLDLYANLMGLLIALASVAGGYLVLRKKRSVLGRQMALVDSAMKLQNPVERYRRLCNIQKASSKLLQYGKISENNYMILDNKIRDYKNVLEKKHPDIEKVAELPQSPYQQSEKDDIKLDSHGEYK